MAQSKLEDIQHHQEIILNWTTPNFKALYNNAKENVYNQVFAREYFKIREWNWEVYLQQYNEEDLAITFPWLRDDSNSISLEYSLFLKSSEGQFIHTLKAEVNKYTPQNPMLTDKVRGFKLKSLSELENEGFLSDGQLHMRLIVSVYSNKGYLKMKASADLQNGLDSGVGTDVTFIFVEEEGSEKVIGEIKAHRAILSLRSSVFATMFGSGMTEATVGEVKISDLAPKAFRMLLDFIYSGEVDSKWGSVAAELLYGAHKYELARLLTHLCENVGSVLTVRNVMKIRNLADLCDLQEVLESTLKFIIIKDNAKEFLKIHDIVLKDSL